MSGLSSYLLSTLSKVGGIGGSGIPDFHFTIGDKVEQDTGNSIWEQHNSLSTVARGSSYTAVAQNALKRMRTLRHPGILRYLDGAETADAIYIATERVTPLSLSLDSDGCDDELKRWGLYKIVETLRFVNEDCKLVHANVSTASVFVTKAGEWRLGGLELVDVLSGDPSCSQIYRHYTAAIPGYAAHMSPEIQSLSWGSVEDGKLGAIDGWGLACLIYQVYNGTLTSAAQLHAQGTIPKALWPMYQRMLVTDLRRRLTPSELLQSALRPHSFFDSEFIRTSIFLENIAVKEEDEKAKFFSGLASVIEGFPHIYCKFKILPELLKLMEFGGGGAKVLSSIIQIGKGLNEEEYNEHVSPAIVQLFGSNDRALRFSLLEHIGSFIAAIPTSVVSKKVFPDFVTGFMDAAPAIREATVKASLTIAPKLGQKVLNNDLVKQLVRMIADPEPGIRTNALICIGKLCTAKKGVLDLEDGGVSESSQRYVICPALLQALRDPFPPVRSASLAVANACAAKWDPVDIARRVIPTISLLLVDGEKPVRVAALKAINAMVARVETHSQDMPDTAMKKVASTPSNIATAASASSAGGKQSDIVSAPGSSTAASMNAQTEAAANMAAASDGWSGWAVSSLSNTISGALSLASSLPISQQQQQTSLDIQAESAGTGGTSVNPVNSKPFSTVAAASAAPKVNDTSSGWEFNDDDWEGNTGNAWDEDDDWDTEISTPNNQPTAISPTSPNTRGPSSGRKSGGMTMTSTIKPSAAIPSTPPQAPVTKTPLKLSKPALKKPGLSGSNTTTTTTTTPPTGTQRRKGLGAMKLGGGSKSPALPDDLF
ncbi:Nuclear aminoacylation-dependent tRNA export pathway component [Coemansia sp. RSA 487]|nr:Nuclear aminoacylation-dependent tRNA export pathway component [Coemansia sp. RSA 1843]KAJ2092740.1 Nuclear aminoacylation-dependent tRNA export pathway component [Coemansia sp. RSA 986]KAJ2217761.1 Nuclear aminoacylation-dependent tRNA export pathway component [Coemansia sp. RSA 487]